MEKEDNREIEAKKISKDWYEIIIDGKKKKFYFNVYYNPETREIQIGSFKKDSELYPDPLPLWKALTRQLIWNNGALWVMEFLDELISEQADMDMLTVELSKIDWKELEKKSKWIRFSGGSEQ